jgi:1-hydroxycarotenoid 3,4-desaturase
MYPGLTPADRSVPGVALLLLAEFRNDARLWGWSRFVLGTFPLRGTPGLRFARQLGSGHEGGFGLRPSGTIQGLFLVFDTLGAAEQFRREAPLLKAYAARALETFSVLAVPLRARGSWAGSMPFAGASPQTAQAQLSTFAGLGITGVDVRGVGVRGVDVTGVDVTGVDVSGVGAMGVDAMGVGFPGLASRRAAPGHMGEVVTTPPRRSPAAPAAAIPTVDHGVTPAALLPWDPAAPVAALTRASIRVGHLRNFWSKAPAAQRDLASHPQCLLAVGLGEAPLVRQATFSIWSSAHAMDAYARSGAHLDAIRAAGKGGYFAEDMFVRFVPIAPEGQWRGRRVELPGLAPQPLQLGSGPEALRGPRWPAVTALPDTTQTRTPVAQTTHAHAALAQATQARAAQALAAHRREVEPLQAAAQRHASALTRDDTIAVVGAGVGGLAAAIRLAARGHRVTVFERDLTVGGKMRALPVDGRAVPCGPTVFTMRWVFDELLGCAGERLEDRLKLTPLKVLARHAWSETSRLDLHADPAASVDAVGRFSGADQARRFASFCAEARRIHDTLVDPFIRAQRPDLWDMLHRLGAPGLLTLSGLGPFASLWKRLGAHFPDPRLRQLFARYATYCGTSPWLAPATLELIAHIEMEGVWSVEGGMPALAGTLAEVAAKLGAEIRTGTAVDEIVVHAARARAVRLQGGEQLPVRAVVHNGDVRALAAGLHGAAAARAHRASASAPLSLSALTLCLNAKATGFPLAHHNVFFQDDYRSEFDDVFALHRLPRKPTVYLCAPDRVADAQSAQPQSEAMLLLVNAPAALRQPLGSTVEDHKEIAACQATMMRHLRGCGLDLNYAEHQCRITTPADFHARFPASGGALYGPAANGWMATFARAQGHSALPGLYLAGGTVHPGPGVPMAAMSGILAAEALMADLASTSVLHPAATSGGMSMRSAMTDDMASP